jgi:hypothetical protein
MHVPNLDRIIAKAARPDDELGSRGAEGVQLLLVK